jgi:hypothetical protein
VAPRCHPDPLLGASTSTATRRRPSRTTTCPGERLRGWRDGVRAHRHRVLEGDRFFDIVTTHAKASDGRRLPARSGDQPRPRSGAAAPRAAGVVPQHVVLGARRPRPAACAWGRRGGRGLGDGRRACLPRSLCRRRRPLEHRESSSATTRPTSQQSSGRTAGQAPHPKDAVNAAIVRTATTPGSGWRHRHQGRLRWHFEARRAGGDGHGPAPADREATAAGLSRRPRRVSALRRCRGARETAEREADEFYGASSRRGR